MTSPDSATAPDRLQETAVSGHPFSETQPQSRPTFLDPADAELTAGARVGRYLVIDRLGAGGMGVVYVAYDPELDRKVALKLLRAGLDGDEHGRLRLLREAQALARLDHPNVVAVHDAGVADGRVWLAMELVAGQTLRAWCQRPRAWSEVLATLEPAGRGLMAAHAAGLVHRDFKPKTRSPLGRSPFSPSGRILKNRGVSRPGPWRVVPPHAAVLATGWQSRCRHERMRALPSARISHASLESAFHCDGLTPHVHHSIQRPT